MNTFVLKAVIKGNLDMLKDLIHFAGNLFYEKHGDSYKIVYFSNSRIVIYEGKIDKEIKDLLKMEGYRVKKIEIDEVNNILSIEN